MTDDPAPQEKTREAEGAKRKKGEQKQHAGT